MISEGFDSEPLPMGQDIAGGVNPRHRWTELQEAMVLIHRFPPGHFGAGDFGDFIMGISMGIS
jgi:hypothetical protein